ncbi:MAG: ribosome small subunit-dependent GTPase A [Gammaproteobacteria bacterium]|nr:ribosome small subunit-dependent GTPase A [Gammaproteobacteria bacterium]
MHEGRVIVNYRRNALIETKHGERIDCLVKGRNLKPVCGDVVNWVKNADGTCVIKAITPRHSLLYRYDSRKKRQPLAANIEQIVIVAATEPAVDVFTIDKYLVAAHAVGVKAMLVFNKADLAETKTPPTFAQLKIEYENLGYPVKQTSVVTGKGIKNLAEDLRNHINVLVGPSGVGKSSLVKSLLPDEDIMIEAISEARGEGRHTTTRTTLYHLPTGGDLIDSPGVREFILWPMPVAELGQYFPEFNALKEKCRFSNCLHLAEPACAVKIAAAEGDILPRRYDSYRGLAKIMDAQYREY